jgi:proline dehydrogenase
MRRSAAVFTQRLDFTNAKVAYSGLPTMSIARASLVFRACSIKPLVTNSEWLLKTARATLSDHIVGPLVRGTFFAHFCAGEAEDSILPTVEFLRRNGVGAILDYAAEGDLDEEEVAEVAAASSASKLESAAAAAAAVAAAPSNRAGVDSARVYDYTTEASCDANTRIFESAIRAVHNVTPEGFAAIKVTALGNPALLERWSTSLVEIRAFFDRLDVDGSGRLTWDTFRRGWIENFRFDEENDQQMAWLQDAFERFDSTGDGTIDAVEWTTRLRPEDMARIAGRCLEEGPFARAALSETEAALVASTIARVRGLAEMAHELDVRLMIDAEHSYFQPAIDNVVLDLQREFNGGERALIFNTFQCYLTESTVKVAEHIERSEREGWQFAAKVVRGAYMVLERERAAQLGVPSPIHATIEATHDCFDGVVRSIIQRAAVREGRSRANVLVASHNQRSVEKTIEAMAEAQIDPATGGVYFGQLLGMADHLTFTLGNAGYRAYKYVPYGPWSEVMPYLIRRAQENSDMLGGVAAERSMLWGELKRRIFARS